MNPESPTFRYGECQRDYILFATLANVRNDYNITPIASPRDLPLDTSKAVLDETEEWGCDAHTRTWLSLKELLAHNWDKEITETGMVILKEYINFKRNGHPNSWAKGICGPTEVSNKEMDAIIKSKSNHTNYCTTIKWTFPGNQRLGYFREYLQKLSNYMENTETRIVFWFDN